MDISSLSDGKLRGDIGKAELSARVRQEVADFLARGGKITSLEPRKRRVRYVNPCKHSPATFNRMSVDRVNGAYGIPYVFPSAKSSAFSKTESYFY
jgi:hypothetical protein